MRNAKIDTSKLELFPVPEGYKVRLYHATPAELKRLPRNPTTPPPLYATYATLVDAGGNEVAFGCSFCSHKDVPNRKLGNIIAHNRCIKSFSKKQNA